MPLKNKIIGSKAYPLNSKRLELRQIQHLASALDLPITATWSNLEAMINGKLAETGHDTTSIQVYNYCSEWRGRTIIIKRHEGTELVTPPLPMAANRSSPIPSHKDSDYKEGFTVKMTQLQNLLQILEEKTIVLHTELQLTKELIK